MIILVATSVLGSVGAAVGTGVLLRGRSSAPSETVKHEEKTSEAEKVPQTVHPLGELVINLADHGDELRYVKVSVAVGYEEKVDEEELKKFEPVLRDAVISSVSHMSFDDLHQKNGLEVLKKALFTGMKDRVPKTHLLEVYVEGFAMQ